MRDILILVLALSTDTFVASIAYGANRLKISCGKVIAVNGICSGLSGSCSYSWKHDQRISAGRFCKGSGFFLPVSSGCNKAFGLYHKKIYQQPCEYSQGSDIFHLRALSIIINIYGNPMAADWDHSKSLSWKETIMFSLAMSLDSLVAGALSGFLMIPPGLTALSSLIVWELPSCTSACSWDISLLH